MTMLVGLAAEEQQGPLCPLPAGAGREAHTRSREPSLIFMLMATRSGEVLRTQQVQNHCVRRAQHCLQGGRAQGSEHPHSPAMQPQAPTQQACKPPGHSSLQGGTRPLTTREGPGSRTLHQGELLSTPPSCDIKPIHDTRSGSDVVRIS